MKIIDTMNIYLFFYEKISILNQIIREKILILLVLFAEAAIEFIVDDNLIRVFFSEVRETNFTAAKADDVSDFWVIVEKNAIIFYKCCS